MYNFDEIIDRRNTNALKLEGYRSYIFGVEDSEDAMEFPFKDDEFIHMWVADMEFATPEVVIDGMRERLDRRIFGYTRLFTDEYYHAFVKWCESRYGWTFEREHLVTSNGIIPALYELVDYICEEDEKVLFLTPSYAYFQYAADVNNREAVRSDLINDNGYYTIDFADLAEKASDPKITLLILCNPHNPTGRVWTEEELTKIGEIALANDLWVISDEIHCDLIRTNKTHIPLAKLFPKNDKIVTAMSTSKTFNLAGMMFSNIIIPNSDLRKIWLDNHYNFDNPLSFAASQAAYEKGAEWVEALRKYLDGNFKFTQEYLEKNLPKSQMAISEATYLAWINVGEYFDDNEDLVSFFANEAGVLLEDGDMFVSNSEGFIRLNLACPRSMLEEGLLKICNAVNSKTEA